LLASTDNQSHRSTSKIERIKKRLYRKRSRNNDSDNEHSLSMSPVYLSIGYIETYLGLAERRKRKRSRQAVLKPALVEAASQV